MVIDKMYSLSWVASERIDTAIKCGGRLEGGLSKKDQCLIQSYVYRAI